MSDDDRVDLLLCWGRVDGLGGTEARMVEVVEHLVDRDLVVASSAMTQDASTSPLGRLLHSSGARIYETHSARQLRRLLRRLRPSAAIAHGLRASLVLRAASSTIPARPRVVDARNGLELGRPAAAWLIDRLSQTRVDVYMTNSAKAAELLASRGISPRKIAVNESALRASWYQPAPVDRDPTSVMIVGNNRPEKNHEFALRAIARCAGPVQVHLYTDDGRLLREFWSSLGTPGGKTLTVHEGVVLQPRDYARAAVLFHPSISESYPRAILEAKAQGTRVVASGVGSIPQMLTKTDYQCSASDPDQAARALDRAIEASRLGLPTDDGEPRAVTAYCDRLLGLCGIQGR